MDSFRSRPTTLNDVLPDIESLFRRKTFDESMYDCLTQGWLERYDAVRDVRSRLQTLAPTVRKACRRFVADVFDALIIELNAYGMCLSVLIGRPVFPIDESGKVSFEHGGVAENCERRRKTIKSLVARLADDRQAPVFDEAFQFESAETFAERKRLVHRKTAEIQENAGQTSQLFGSARDQQPAAKRCRASDWDFDRIVYNIWLAQDGVDAIDVATAVQSTNTEVERAVSVTGTLSLMALHYSLGPLRKAVAADPKPPLADVDSALTETKSLVKARAADAGGQIRRSVAEIEALIQARPAAPSS